MLEPHPSTKIIDIALAHIAPFHMLAGIDILSGRYLSFWSHMVVRKGLFCLAGLSALGLLKKDLEDEPENNNNNNNNNNEAIQNSHMKSSE